MSLFIHIVNLMFYGGFAVFALVPHATAKTIGLVVAGVAAAILTILLLVGVL